MKQIIYVSQRNASTTEKDIDDIVNTSKDFNHSEGITGVLVSLPNYFYQVLEGPATVLDELIERIRNDQRHCNMKVFINTSIPAQQFGKWSMVHHEIDEQFADYFWVLSKFAAEPNYDEIQTRGIEMMLLGLT